MLGEGTTITGFDIIFYPIFPLTARENYYDSDLSMLSYFWLTVCYMLSTISNPSSPTSSLFVVFMSSPSSIKSSSPNPRMWVCSSEKTFTTVLSFSSISLSLPLFFFIYINFICFLYCRSFFKG